MRAGGGDGRGLCVEVIAQRGGRALEQQVSRGPDRGGRGGDQRLRGAERLVRQIGVGDGAGDEADALRLVCTDARVGQNHRLGAAQADEAGQQPAHPAVGAEADAGIGRSEMRRARRDHDIPQQGEA
ncbi:hypothetical protein WR25_26583 [Diploscapter pachys]|uniref:Uncharacterized protein n=1 Tax=Diploscapter pachys TaxID=2018661 RepID=A0A2A2KIV3_9BILA|nr:hypothetical protein WR25_26583 [Diploscapter pachys]